MKIVKYPSNILRIKCIDVPLDKLQSTDFETHIYDMRTCLAASPNGVALASNQIGGGYNLFIVKNGLKLSDIVINPTWTPASVAKFVEQEEGCLSIPHFGVRIRRYDSVHMTWTNLDGSVKDNMFSGLEAQIIQHECDHLSGKVILDHLDKASHIAAYNDIIRRRKKGQ